MRDAPIAVVDAKGFHGIFAALRKLDVIDLVSDDVYAGAFANFWNRYFGNDVRDIPHFERLLPAPRARVLDLACGSGRIGISLARSGARVDGLELSPAMLDLVEANLRFETPELRNRLRFFSGNMCDFSLVDRYDLVVLGTTSVSLLLTSDQRRAMFESVRAHLLPGGRFVFNLLDFSGERWKKYDHYHDVWSHETDDGQEFAIVGQRLYPESASVIFNVYREFITWSGETTRTMASSTKAWIEPEELRAHARSAGMAIVDEFEDGDVRYFVAAPTDET